MSEGIVIAFIAAVPATVASTAAWSQARAANRAVNRTDGPTISQRVKTVDERTAGLAEAVDDVAQKLDRHLAAHQEHRDREHALELLRLAELKKEI